MSNETNGSGSNGILFAAIVLLSGLMVVFLVALDGPGRLITLALAVLGMLACVWRLAKSGREGSTAAPGSR